MHSWRKFYVLVNGLPMMGSHYGAAVRNDPDLAEVVARQEPADGVKWSPPPAEWSLREELQAQLVDALGVIATLLSDMPTAVKKRSKPPSRVARPVTEMEKARKAAERRIEAELDQLISAAHAVYEAEHRGE